MRAGLLRHRVTLYRPIETRTLAGESLIEWEEYDIVWASVEPVSGGEEWLSSKARENIDVSIRMRYRPDVEAKHRAVHAGVNYEITAIIIPDTRKIEMVLSCVKVG